MRRRSAGVDRGRGRFLDELLVAPLHRAVALAEVDDVAVRVGEDLDLDVARALDGALEQQPRVAERRLRFGRRRSERGVELAPRSSTQPHAAAAAAGRGLDHQRIADAAALRRGSVVAILRPRRRSRAGTGTPARSPCAGAPRDLSAIARIAAGGGPIQTRPGGRDRLGEVGALAQEAVAGMDRAARRRRRAAATILSMRR